VSETVAKITRSATARLELERPGPAWRPGLFVTAEVEIAEAESPLVIAEGAVQTIDEETVVFVRDGKSFEARPVRLGRHGHDAKGERVHEVLAGLNKGELYVVEGSFLLKAELGKASAGHAH
jgi:cobalt-zinc-cadmium efflux system membrane fusion protein